MRTWLLSLAGAVFVAVLSGASVAWALTDHTVAAGLNAAGATIVGSCVAGYAAWRATRRLGGRRGWAALAAGVVLAVAVNGVAVADTVGSDDAGSESGPSVTVGDGPEGPAPSEDERRLARAFAPVLRLDSSEHFLPLSRARYLVASDLRVIADKQDEPVPFVRTVESLPQELGCARCRYYLDIDGARPTQGATPYRRIEDQVMPPTANPLVYWHARSDYPSGAIAIQYWFFYLYNDFKNKHESDWEHVTVIVTPSENSDFGYALDAAFYSAHEGGHKRLAATIRPFGTRPVVFVARGSHANYFVPGDVRVRPCESRVCRFAKVTEHKDGCGNVVLPADEETSIAAIADQCGRPPQVRAYLLSPLLPPKFVGDYAKGNFIGPASIPNSTFPDPQLRAALWNDPLAEVRAASLDAELPPGA